MRVARAILCGPVAALVVAGSAAPGANAQSSKGLSSFDVVDRAFRNLYGFSSTQWMTSTTTSQSGATITRSIQITRSAGPSELDRSIIRFLSPPDLRGIGLLLLERSDRSSDAFLYQPAFQRVRRVSLAQRSDPFFGTDLSIEDIESKRALEWQLAELAPGEASGRAAWRVDLTPRGADTAYDRVVIWVDRENPILLRAEFYMENELAKTMTADPSSTAHVDDHIVPTRLVFERPGVSRTDLSIDRIVGRSDLSDALFTRSALEFGSARSDARDGR